MKNKVLVNFIQTLLVSRQITVLRLLMEDFYDPRKVTPDLILNNRGYTLSILSQYVKLRNIDEISLINYCIFLLEAENSLREEILEKQAELSSMRHYFFANKMNLTFEGEPTLKIIRRLQNELKELKSELI